MPAPKSIAPRKNWMTAINEDAGSGLRHIVSINITQIPTTGVSNTVTMVPEDGYLHSVDLNFNGTLVANDTNYVTFALENRGQNGSGTVQMLATTDLNTTKLTGGSGIVQFARKTLTISSTISNLAVKAGDGLRLYVTVTGTLGGAVTGGTMILRFNP